MTLHCLNNSLVINTPWSLGSAVVNLPGSLNFPVVNMPWILDSPCDEYVHREVSTSGQFITSIRTGIQKKMTDVWYSSESGLHGVFITGESWLAGVFGTNLCNVILVDSPVNSSPSTLDSPVRNNTLRSHNSTVVNTPRSLISPVVNTRGRLWKQITPRIFEKNWNPVKACLMSQEKLFDEKETRRKISWHCPFDILCIVVFWVRDIP